MEKPASTNGTSIKYQPKFGRVLIKREVQEKIGSIILVDAKRHATCEGVIAALGETAGWVEVYQDGTLTPLKTMNVGDKVIFGRHSGMWLDATYGDKGANDDGQFFICQDADILAVIKED